MPFEHDESLWPIVVDRTLGDQSDDDIATYLARTEALLSRAEPFLSIFDASRGRLVEPQHKRRIAHFIEEHNTELARLRIGFAFVSDSLLNRAMLHGTYWLKKPPYPYAIVRSFAAARRWANQLLAARAHPIQKAG